jgi:hypothetical protein
VVGRVLGFKPVITLPGVLELEAEVTGLAVYGLGTETPFLDLLRFSMRDLRT